MSLPGWYVIQNVPTCWVSTLSMLTGIDVELFNESPYSAPRIYADICPSDDWMHIDVQEHWPWQKLLHDNGYAMVIHDTKPETENYSVFLLDITNSIAHIVAVSGDVLYDPVGFSGMTLGEYLNSSPYTAIQYVTVEEY